MISYNKDTISNAIKTEWAGKTVHFVERTDSTNIMIKNLAKEGAEHGTLAVAEFQTAGRGRFDRKWTSDAGSAIMMTLLLRPQIEPIKAPMLTLVMGLSVAQAVQKLGFDVTIKWPNDVVISRKKICGILTEMSLDGMHIRHVGIGVGINVNIKEFPEELTDKATSLFLEKDREYDRTEIIGLTMEAFEENYKKFMKSEDLAYLKEEYEKILANKDQPVRVIDKNQPFQGTCLGINNNGELLVQCQDGNIVSVGAGEVSVRGLYSYV